MILSLVQNISILIALSAVHQMIVRQCDKDTFKYQVLSGLLFGGIGATSMVLPLNFAPGIFLDGRSIILGVSGLFGGPIVASIAAAICAAYRLLLGGPGALTGIGITLESAGLGVAFYYLRQRNERLMGIIPLIGFAFLIHAVMLALVLALPDGTGHEVLRQAGLPLLVVYPLATVLLSWTFIDNEERLKRDEALRRSEEKYRNLVENVTGIIWETDTSARFTYVSNQAQTILGYAPSEMLGKTVFDFMAPDSSENNMRRFTTAYEDPGEFLGSKNSLVHRDGRIVMVETCATPVFSSEGLLSGFHGIDIDITERRQTEDALWESERRFRAISDSAQDAIIMLDNQGLVTFWNAAAERIFGYGAAEVLGQNVHSLLAPSRYLDKHLAAFEAFKETGWGQSAGKTLELYALRKNREEFPIELSLSSFQIDGHWHAAAFVRDITERKRAEDSLLDSQERLNLALESSRACIWDRNILENKAIWDDYQHRLFGLPPGTYSGNSRDFFSMIHPDDRERVRDEKTVALNGSADYSTTYRVIWPDSNVHFLADRGRVYRDDAGQPVRMIGVRWDITELKQAEEALRESQQQLANIIDFLPDATLVIDNEGKVIAWNKALEEMTGVKAQDVIGKGDHEYAVPLYGERRPILIDLVLNPGEEVEPNYHKIERKGTVLAAEAYVTGTMGGEMYLLGKASVLRDSKGCVVGAIESMRDITERRRVEEALAMTEERYRSIFENAVEGIYQTTVEGRCINANPALAEILGYDSPEELMNTISDLASQLYVNPERRTELLQRIEEYGSVREFETQFYRKDESIAWVALNMHAVRDKNGKVAYLEGTVQDITDSKILEAQLNQAQKLEAIGTLAGGIAHDFNNILSPIIGYSELSLNSVPENSRLHHNLEQILLSGKRAKDLVKQILTFSRKTEQEQKPVQVALLVKETLKLLRSSLPSTIEIRQALDEDALQSTVMADPTQIHRVLMNLITNAAHAMREKGGVLSIALRNENIDSSARTEIADLEPGAYLRLSISDTGHGMDETVRRRIFDPYFTTKGPSEGTGLGLAVVYGIVKKLSGGITLSSKTAEGTTFNVYLPRTRTIQPPVVAGSASMPTGKGLVLLVDDEKMIVDMLKDMLESLGYEVVARYSSSDALQAFETHAESFDLVITDMTMPHMTGLDLARAILAVRADIPIILCTGFSEAIDEDRIKLYGIQGLLMKPIALHDLSITASKVLARNNLQINKAQ